MKWFTLMAALTVLTAVAVVADDEDEKKVRKNRKEPVTAQEADEGDRWMHAKLDAAQQIFAGLTHGDLKTVKKSAQAMLVVHVMESWVKEKEFSEKSRYQGQLNAFEFANKELIRQAEDNYLDGALDAWVRLSRSCVECHKLIRDPARAI